MGKTLQFKMTDLHYATLDAVAALKPETEFSAKQPSESAIRQAANKKLSGAFTTPANPTLEQLVNLGLLKTKSSLTSTGSLFFLTEKGEEAVAERPPEIPLTVRNQSSVVHIKQWDGVSRSAQISFDAS